jgi:hypothetical protein
VPKLKECVPQGVGTGHVDVRGWNEVEGKVPESLDLASREEVATRPLN